MYCRSVIYNLLFSIMKGGKSEKYLLDVSLTLPNETIHEQSYRFIRRNPQKNNLFDEKKKG